MIAVPHVRRRIAYTRMASSAVNRLLRDTRRTHATHAQREAGVRHLQRGRWRRGSRRASRSSCSRGAFAVPRGAGRRASRGPLGPTARGCQRTGPVQAGIPIIVQNNKLIRQQSIQGDALKSQRHECVCERERGGRYLRVGLARVDAQRDACKEGAVPVAARLDSRTHVW
jgi:hypothetical protein